MGPWWRGGNNDYGQTTVPPGLSRVTAIAAGTYHNVALKNDGSVVAWGFDGWCQATVPAAALDGVRLILQVLAVLRQDNSSADRTRHCIFLQGQSPAPLTS